MDFFEQIPEATKNMVHIFAAQGKPPAEIGFLTRLEESVVERILAQPASAELQAVAGSVNTTPKSA